MLLRPLLRSEAQPSLDVLSPVPLCGLASDAGLLGRAQGHYNKLLRVFAGLFKDEPALRAYCAHAMLRQVPISECGAMRASRNLCLWVCFQGNLHSHITGNDATKLIHGPGSMCSSWLQFQYGPKMTAFSRP